MCFPGSTPALAFMSPVSFCLRNSNKIQSVMMLLISHKYYGAGHAVPVLGAEDEPVAPGEEGERRARRLAGSRRLRSCSAAVAAGLGPRGWSLG